MLGLSKYHWQKIHRLDVMVAYWTAAPLCYNNCHPTYDGKVYDLPGPHAVDQFFHDHCLSCVASDDCGQKVEMVVDEDHYMMGKVGSLALLIG